MNRGNSILSTKAIKAADSGNLVAAIKIVREETGLGLREAKDLVDSHVGNTGKPPSSARHTEEMPVEAVAALRKGKLIEAVRRYREKNAIGLKDGREAVEKYLEQDPVTGKQFRESAARERKGVMKIVFVLSGSLIVGYLAATGKLA